MARKPSVCTWRGAACSPSANTALAAGTASLAERQRSGRQLTVRSRGELAGHLLTPSVPPSRAFGSTSRRPELKRTISTSTLRAGPDPGSGGRKNELPWRSTSTGCRSKSYPRDPTSFLSRKLHSSQRSIQPHPVPNRAGDRVRTRPPLRHAQRCSRPRGRGSRRCHRRTMHVGSCAPRDLPFAGKCSSLEASVRSGHSTMALRRCDT